MFREREREETAVTGNSPPQHLMATQPHATDMDLTIWSGKVSQTAANFLDLVWVIGLG